MADPTLRVVFIEDFENPILDGLNLKYRRIGPLRVIFCLECLRGLQPGGSGTHLTKDHGKDYSELSRSGVIAVIYDLHLSTEDQIRAFSSGLVGSVVPALDFVDVIAGWKCIYCNLIFGSEGNMKNHRSSCKPAEGPIIPLKNVPRVPCQTILTGKGKSFFEVIPKEAAAAIDNQIQILKEIQVQQSIAADVQAQATPQPRGSIELVGATSAEETWN
ncbi:hypothetical protein TWF281_004632 [Arthrobotrys megalospora]